MYILPYQVVDIGDSVWNQGKLLYRVGRFNWSVCVFYRVYVIFTCVFPLNVTVPYIKKNRHEVFKSQSSELVPCFVLFHSCRQRSSPVPYMLVTTPYVRAFPKFWRVRVMFLTWLNFPLRHRRGMIDRDLTQVSEWSSLSFILTVPRGFHLVINTFTLFYEVIRVKNQHGGPDLRKTSVFSQSVLTLH